MLKNHSRRKLLLCKFYDLFLYLEKLTINLLFIKKKKKKKSKDSSAQQ